MDASDPFIQFTGGYLEGKLSKKDLTEFLASVEDSEEGRDLLAQSAVIHRLLEIVEDSPISTDVIMQALPRKGQDTATKVLQQITGFERAVPAQHRERVLRIPKLSTRMTAPALRRRRSRKPRGLLILFKPLAALAASLLIGLGIWWIAQQSSGPGTLSQPIALATVEPRGSIEILRRNTSITASRQTAIFAGDTILTGPHEQAVIRYRDDGTAIRVRSATRLTLRSAATGKQLSLEQGAVFAQVAPQARTTPCTIDTPMAEVRVLGTQFRVTARSDVCLIDVLTGKVRVTRSSDGAAADIGAGQKVAVHEADAPLTPLAVSASIVGHLRADQVADIDKTLRTAHAFAINTLTCDDKLILSTPTKTLRRALLAAREQDIRFLVKFDVEAHRSEVTNEAALRQRLQGKVDSLILENDYDGFYFAVSESDRNAQALLDAMTHYISSRQPGTEILAGMQRPGDASAGTWHLGY